MIRRARPWSAGLHVSLAVGGALVGCTQKTTELQTSPAPPAAASVGVQLKSPLGSAPAPVACAEWPTDAPASLFVRYTRTAAPAMKLAPEFPLHLAGQKVVINDRGEPPDRDSGDGSYGGRFVLDARALCERHARLADLRRSRPLRFVRFEGRALTESGDLPEIDLQPLWLGQPVDLTAAMATPDTIDDDRSLFVTDIGVLEDPARTYTPCGKEIANGVWQPAGTPKGKWTAGYLLEKIAGGPIAAPRFTLEWLEQLDPPSGTNVNTFAVPTRSNVRGRFLVPWCNASPGCKVDLLSPLKVLGPLDVGKAPFRLLAIVNRIDLADVFGASSAGRLAEVRFVFQGQRPDACGGEVSFFVIFEFGVPKQTCAELAAWAQDWIDLAVFAPGTTDYNDGLETLVDTVVGAATLLRVRTSESSFIADGVTAPDGESWEMREFQLTSGALRQTTVENTPDRSFKDGPKLAYLKAWIELNGAAVDGDHHRLPRGLSATVPIEAAAASMRPPLFGVKGTFWELANVGTAAYPDVRHHFSLGTCNGCHAGETAAFASHVRAKGGFGAEIERSGFLNGITVDDPREQKDGTGTIIQRTYADLDRRAAVLDCVATFNGTPCLCPLTLQKLSMSH